MHTILWYVLKVILCAVTAIAIVMMIYMIVDAFTKGIMDSMDERKRK